MHQAWPTAALVHLPVHAPCLNQIEAATPFDWRFTRAGLDDVRPRSRPPGRNPLLAA